jgi:hypothetical protein
MDLIMNGIEATVGGTPQVPHGSLLQFTLPGTDA